MEAEIAKHALKLLHVQLTRRSGLSRERPPPSKGSLELHQGFDENLLVNRTSF